MNAKKISAAWITTIAAGSSLLALLGIIVLPPAAPAIFLFSLALSTVISAPALGVVLIVNKASRGRDFLTRFRHVTIAHGCSYLVIVCAGMIMLARRSDYGVNYDEMMSYAGVVTFYACIGAITWKVNFGKLWRAERRKQRKKMPDTGPGSYSGTNFES